MVASCKSTQRNFLAYLECTVYTLVMHPQKQETSCRWKVALAPASYLNLMIKFAKCFKMGKAQGYRTFLKHGARLNSPEPIIWVMQPPLGLTLHLLAIATTWITFPSVVAESTATNRVGNDKKHKHNYVYNCHLSPVLFYVLQDSSFAWIAVVAKVGIAPNCTVRVFCRWWWSSLPDCCIHKYEITTGRWLATSWLQSNKKQYCQLSDVHLKKRGGDKIRQRK